MGMTPCLVARIAISICENRCSRRRFSDRGCVRSTSRSMSEPSGRSGAGPKPGAAPAAAAGPSDTTALRRIADCKSAGLWRCSGVPARAQSCKDGVLRYSRLAVCATNTTEALNRYRRRVKVGSRVSMSAEFEFFRVLLQLCEQLLPAAAPRVVHEGEVPATHPLPSGTNAPLNTRENVLERGSG